MSNTSGKPFILAMMTLLVAVQRVSGGILCENLPQEFCAFSVSTDGKRCMLEKYDDGTEESGYRCKQSPVNAAGLAEWIEADECVAACGANRSWTGIAVDPLLDVEFLAKLCSTPCYGRCPNMVDLYFNLAEAQGVVLPEMCTESRREILENLDTADASASAPAPSAGDSSNSNHTDVKGAAPSIQATSSVVASASLFIFYVLRTAKLI